jgi:hypothetical protein
LPLACFVFEAVPLALSTVVFIQVYTALEIECANPRSGEGEAITQ